MNNQTNLKETIRPSNERSKVMNTQTRSKPMDPTIRFLFIVLAILVLTSCSTGDRASSSSCFLDSRVTIDVTDARPREVFDQLADQLNCRITVFPFFWHRVTVQMKNAAAHEILAVVCPQIDAKWIYNVNGHLSIMPLTPIDKWVLRAREESNRQFEEMNKKFGTRLPVGMIFENVPMSAVLEEISKASGLELTPMEGEADRLVSIDVSGMTVDKALEAIVRYTDGEGSVVVKTWNGYAQRRLVDKP